MIKKNLKFNSVTAFALVAIIAGCGHTETSSIEPAYIVDAGPLAAEFLDGEEAASAKYVDQTIVVTGPIFEVDKTEGKITGVKISHDELAIVNCSFQEAPAEMPESGLIAIKGVCSGFMGDSESMLPGGTVELKRCVIAEPKK